MQGAQREKIRAGRGQGEAKGAECGILKIARGRGGGTGKKSDGRGGGILPGGKAAIGQNENSSSS